jgi:hypothetical protein
MIQVIDGEAQIYYQGSWSQIAYDLEILYATQQFTSINAYGLIFEINDIMDVIAAADYIAQWGDF